MDVSSVKIHHSNSVFTVLIVWSTVCTVDGDSGMIQTRGQTFLKQNNKVNFL